MSEKPETPEAKCDSCGASQSEAGGEFHAWSTPTGDDAVYCDVCYSDIRRIAAREEQIMRALAPGIALLRRHWNLSLKEILDALAELATAEEEGLERMMQGGSEDDVRTLGRLDIPPADLGGHAGA